MEKKNVEHQWPGNGTRSEQDQVAQRAYELYQARGREAGHELDDWLQAEGEARERNQVIQSV